MLLLRLGLSHFRNYTQKSFSFSHKMTLVVGPNTAGKTSLLEALMFIATGKSFRAGREREMIATGEEVGRVTAAVSTRSDSADGNVSHSRQTDTLEIVITSGTVLGKKAPYKTLKVNGVGKNSINFVGRLPAVLFWPEDLRLVTGSPSRRRQYLDIVLSQTNRSYRRSLSTYEKALRIRNKLLHVAREGAPIRPEEMEYWTETILTHGDQIHRARRKYIDFTNTVVIGTKLTKKNNKAPASFTMHYDHSIISPERLNKYKQAEQQAAVTLVGPHRDDFYLTKNHDDDMELHSFGSRGEQRLGVLWLKISEMHYIEKEKGIKPLLLLDDIFSELDHEHRGLVMSIVDNQQTIMTTTDTALTGLSGATVIELDT